MLRRSKAFAAFTVLALALAIAANTTMSSLIDALVFPSYAFPRPEQLIGAVFNAPGIGRLTSFDLTARLAGASPDFEGVSGWGGLFPFAMPQPVIVGGRVRQLPVINVFGNYFRVLGARPAHGALFNDARDADRHLAVISDRLWRSLNGAHRTFAPFGIAIGGDDYTVSGVLEPHGGAPGDADIFLATPAAAVNRVALIRLRPGVTRSHALRELNQLAPGLDPGHSRRATFRLVDAVPIHARVTGIPIALGAATLAVLLIACANIANLLVARGMSRGRELATRRAFGASRLDVARLLFVESGFLALAGGALGMLFSLWTIHLLAAALPANLQSFGLVEPQLSWRVATVGAGLTMISAVVFGLAPLAILRRTKSASCSRPAAAGRRPWGARDSVSWSRPRWPRRSPLPCRRRCWPLRRAASSS